MIVCMAYFKYKTSSFPEPFGVFSSKEMAIIKTDAAEKTIPYSAEYGEFHIYTHIMDKPESDTEQLELHKDYIVRLQNEVNEMEASLAL